MFDKANNMKIEKKVLREYFQKIVDGIKTYELRLADFECTDGDILVLREWNEESNTYTGRILEKEITYVLKTKDIPFWTKEQIDQKGYQIIAFKDLTPQSQTVEGKINDYLIERDWDHLDPSDLAKSITIEGAELLELFQWKNHSVKEINNNSVLKESIKKELADVMIYCHELAIRLGFDTSEMILSKLSHNSKKYPASEMLKDKGADKGNSYYQKRKMEYRATDK